VCNIATAVTFFAVFLMKCVLAFVAVIPNFFREDY